MGGGAGGFGGDEDGDGGRGEGGEGGRGWGVLAMCGDGGWCGVVGFGEMEGLGGGERYVGMLIFGGRGVGLVRVIGLCWVGLLCGWGFILGCEMGLSAWSLFSVLRAGSDYLGKKFGSVVRAG